MRVAVVSLLLLSACNVTTTRIDGRFDAAVVDGGVSDAQGPDGATPDASVGGDAGCTVEAPPVPAAWIPADSGGPAGETVTECLARAGSMTDSRVPEDQGYDLTTFGGGADTQATSCGGMDADGTWYYAANAQRFACGSRIRLVNPERTTCVIVEVADIGPNLCVEAAGERPIWDVSPLAAMELLGGSGFGWSDHEAIFGAQVGTANPLGPCDHFDGPTFLQGFVGGPCTTAADCPFTGSMCMTEADGFPGGYCTQTCGTSCPDRAGPYAYTGCADLTGSGDALCAARCDYTLFPDVGCRDGYGCFTRPHPTNPALSDRRVCLPLACR
jgi:hypothetical protein